MTAGIGLGPETRTAEEIEKASPFFIRQLRNIPELRSAKAKFCGPNLTDTIGVALLCWFQLAALGATALLAAQSTSGWLEIVLYLYVIIFSARALRGLEGMFHEGSHRLFHRSMKINDRLTNLVGGAVFGKSVQAYRPPHWGHHRYLGSKSEADRTNYDRRQYAGLNRSSRIKYVLGIVQRYPLFLWDWLIDVKSSRYRTTLLLAWHLSVTALLVILLGWSQTLLVMSMTIWLPMLLVLPALRMIGEAEEHPYEKVPCSDYGPQITFAATLNNVGILQQMFIHPFGDCWHIVHHLIPTCRQIRQRAIHKLLLEHSPIYRQSILSRTRILEEERRYAK